MKELAVAQYRDDDKWDAAVEREKTMRAKLENIARNYRNGNSV
jgi:hypothetical protein